MAFDSQSHRPTSFMRFYTSRTTRDRIITRSLRRLFSTKCSISQLHCFFILRYNTYLHGGLLMHPFSKPEEPPPPGMPSGAMFDLHPGTGICSARHTPSSRYLLSAGLHLAPICPYQRVPDRVSQAKAGEEAFRPGYVGDQGP